MTVSSSRSRQMSLSSKSCMLTLFGTRNSLTMLESFAYWTMRYSVLFTFKSPFALNP